MSKERRSWRALFPPDDAPTRTSRELALAGVIVAVALVVPIARHAGAGVLDTLWAEDGRVFLQEALALAPHRALARTYAGYLHLGPRLAAELATLAPLGAASELLVLAANALTALSALAVFVSSRTHLASPWIRAVLALAVPLAPPAGVEILNSVANAQWPLLFASFWLLLWRPATTTGVVSASLLLVTTALSAGLGILLLPLAVLRLLAGPRGRDQLPPWLFCSAVALQLVATQTPALPPSSANPSTVVAVFAQRVGIVALAGHRVGGTLWARYGWRWMATAAVMLVAVVVVGVVFQGSRRRWLVLLCAGYAFAFFAASAVLRGGAPAMLWPWGMWHLAGARYSYVPVLLVYSLVAAVLDARPLTRGGASKHLPAGAQLGTLVVLLVAVVGDFRVWNDRTSGPSWSDTVHQARDACGGNGGEVTFAIAPDNWTVTIPCRELHSNPGRAGTVTPTVALRPPPSPSQET
ncbi:MAG: hypothetical protein M3O70_15525 [Actinomycetota bacterium]|nr:hypothetical protein [Actinomycetota bacterium]